MWRFLTGLLFVAALALAGCRAAPIYSPTGIDFVTPPAAAAGTTLTMADYRNAIIRAGATRSWTFEDAGPGHLVGKLGVRGKHFASVDVLYDTAAFSINYRDSQNLNYNAGRREIHPNYNSWVTNLQKDIQAEVTRLKAS